MTTQPPPPPADETSADETPPPGGPGVAQFFDRIRRYGAVRPDDGRWFAGVAAGLARRWGVDPLLVRGGFVLLSIFGGVGLLLYGLGWLFLPHPDGRIHAQEVLRGVVTAGFIGGLLCVLADLGSSGWSSHGWWGPHPFGGGLLLVALVVFAIWWFAGGRHRRGPGGPRGGHGPGGTGGPGWQDRGWQGGGWHGWQGPGSPGPGSQGPGSQGGGSGATPPAGAAPDAAPGDAPSAPADGTIGDPDARPEGNIPPYGTPPSSAAYSGTGGWGAAAWPPARPGGDAAFSGAETSAAVLAPPRPVAPAWAPRPDVQRPLHALTSAVLGLALLAAAVAVAVSRVVAGDHPSVAVAAGVALTIVALGVLAAGISGRRAGALAPLGILLAVVTLAASAPGRAGWAAQRTWTPTTLTGTTSYELGVGTGRLDLSKASVPGATAASPAEVDVRVGVGTLAVVVPSGTAVRVIGSTGAGDIRNNAGLAATSGGAPNALAVHQGPHADLDVRTAADPVVVVRADVGLGTLTIDGPTGQE